MKVLFLSFVVGLGVGVLYGLIRVKSPAPPIVALLGLLGMVLGEQFGIWVQTKKLDVSRAASVCLVGERLVPEIGLRWCSLNPCLALCPIKQLLLRELRKPGRSSSLLRLAIGTLECNMSLARRGFIFTTARESDCLRFT
jgi:XapX domain-containing protein